MLDAVARAFVKGATRLSPSLVAGCQAIRDARRSSQPFVQTPFGFMLAGNESIASGHFERAEVEAFLQQLKGCSVCVDIGANIGLYTCLAGIRGGTVIAIEPSPTNVAILLRNVTRNGLLERAEVFPIGLSSRPGVLPLYGSDTGASFVPGWAGARSGNLVPVNTLDSLLQGRFRDERLLVKMDVEGHEVDVLRGANATLRRDPEPTWIIEIILAEHHPSGINQHFQETFELFWAHGYEARTCDETARRVRREDVIRWTKQRHVDFGSHNYLFAAPASAARG